MGDDYEEVGNHFVTHYFTTFDNDRSELAPLYNENSVCTYEGEQMKGQVRARPRARLPARPPGL